MQSPSVCPMFKQDGTHTCLPLSALIFTLRPVRDLSVCVCVYNLLQPHKSDPERATEANPSSALIPSLSLSLRHVGRCASTCVMERKAIPSPTDSEVVHSSVRPSFRPPDSPFLCFLLPSNGRWRRRKPLITVAGLCGACGRSASAPVMTDD